MTQKEIIPTRIPSITDQFNPFLPVADIGAIEMQLPIVKELLAQSKIRGFKILDLGYNSEMEIPEAEYTPEDFPETDYKILDTIEMTNPSFTEVSIRDFIVKADRIFVLTVKNLNEANWNAVERYKSIYVECKKAKIPFVMIVNANKEEINAFRKKHNFNIPVFLNDETELKAIARSNPSLLVIEKGIMKGKFAHRSTPSFDWIKRNTLKK
jgi:hypothetical protein